ncbi:MAG TPA: hypothetical protein VFO41_08200 [Alphaproteobacteria bacterium]|nr:hypothetical protein [Alphaproteobacteria bacterium]
MTPIRPLQAATPSSEDLLRRRRRGSRLAWLITLSSLPVALLILPTTLLFVIGMVPTLVAMVIDRDPNKYAPITVGSLNFCGVMPAAISLWQNGHTLGRSASLLADPFTWLTMYAAAAVGWLVYFFVPPAVSLVVGLRAEAEIKRLQERQADLIEEWGEEVASREEAAQG